MFNYAPNCFPKNDNLLFSVTLGLVDVGIHIPPAVVHGSKVTLKCLFDLEGDKLYSVKWYRGAREFYRYTASDPNPIKQFKIKGLHVVESESNATQVVLKHVTKEISGQFNCEITADQPSFYTVVKSADLRVKMN
nr:unnamed protein product [Callosobruchus analis]